MAPVSWFVEPSTTRLSLPGKQWVDVKKRLTYGEDQGVKAALVKELRGDGRVTPDLEMIEVAHVMAYLIEWSLCDAQGKPVPIDTVAKKQAALRALAPEKFALIREAIDAHIARVDGQRVAEKKAQPGETASSTTSPSAE